MSRPTSPAPARLLDPREAYPRPPFPWQRQTPPGTDRAIGPAPDHGEGTYVGTARLAGLAAIVTGATSRQESRPLRS